jgi:hypothetical protein
VFRGGMNSYTNGQFHGGAPGVTGSDKAARYKHCVINNGNGTLTTADDYYNPDKHFDAKGAAPNSSDLYTWHWDNIQIYTKENSNCHVGWKAHE